MKIHTDTSALILDTAAYGAFLREQGTSEADMHRLSVFLLLPRASIAYCYPQWHGHYFQASCSIKIYLWESDIRQLNRTLLHETRHFIQDCQGNGDHAKERLLPYHERPCERDAEAFALAFSYAVFLESAERLSMVIGKNLAQWWREERVS